MNVTGGPSLYSCFRDIQVLHSICHIEYKCDVEPPFYLSWHPRIFSPNRENHSRKRWLGTSVSFPCIPAWYSKYSWIRIQSGQRQWQNMTPFPWRQRSVSTVFEVSYIRSKVYDEDSEWLRLSIKRRDVGNSRAHFFVDLRALTVHYHN